MLFNSFEYLLFLPMVLALNYALPVGKRWALLLVASCFIHWVVIPKFVIGVREIIRWGWVGGRVVEKAVEVGRKTLLVASIVASLGLLAAFKYLNFFGATLVDAAKLLGLEYHYKPVGWILPLGLSFHTFQSLSYTIEVYRGRFRAERHLGKYALYVMFFPQLVAGPIERPYNLLPQLHRPRPLDYATVVSALRLMLLGFAKKVLIADNLAAPVGVVYGNLPGSSGPAILVATYFFAFQIYCDFSGYTDIARASAGLLGVNLMENFKSPYLSQTLQEFWRRWHISLTTWFRDYVYFPLTRRRTLHTHPRLNLVIVYLLSGLWHGARWTYVLSFGYQGALVAAFRPKPLNRRVPGTIGVFWRTFLTFNIVASGFIIFRAATLSDAGAAYAGLLHGWGTPALDVLRETGVSAARAWLLVSLVGALLTFEFLSARPRWRMAFASSPAVLRWSLYYSVLLSIALFARGGQQFIYFQF